MSILPASAYVSLAVWVYLLLARGKFWQTLCISNTHAIPPTWPDVAVVIPARNEADVLENTLPTLLACDYPGALRIVLVDDRSEDDTSAVALRIAERLGATQRLSVVQALPLPSGWKGKVWAMECGVQHIAESPNPPRYMLFTDADIAYEKNALTELVKRAEAENLVLASLMVRLRCESLAERFLIPAFVYFFQMLYPFHWVNQPADKTEEYCKGKDVCHARAGGHPARSVRDADNMDSRFRGNDNKGSGNDNKGSGHDNKGSGHDILGGIITDAKTSKVAAAAGGVMLLRRDALQKAGGLSTIRSALIDDCALARALKPQGRISLSLTQHVRSIRAYNDVGTIRQMVSRSAYDQLDYSPLNLAGAIAGLFITFIAPVLATVCAGDTAQLCGVAAWLMMSLSFIPMLRFYDRSPRQSLLLPVIAAFYMAFTLDSAYQHARGKGGLWKGRVQAAEPA